MALDPRRGDDAEPVEDLPPGRDRRGRRADRLLALQRRVHAPDLLGAARLLGRRLEPAGVPAARGLRLRGQPVQLHRDRRQPDRLAGADGQHGRLEAGVDGRALGPLHAPDPARGGAPGRRHQHRLRLGRHDRRRRARELGARRDPLHRLDPGLPVDVEHGRRQHRRLPQLPAHRRRDRRQGLHRRAPERGRRRGRDRDRPRLLRVSGPEVLGGVARLRAEEHVAGAARAARGPGRRVAHGRRLRLLQLHGRRHRRQLLQDPEGGDRRGTGVQQGGDRRRRRLRRQRGLLRLADRDPDRGSRLPDDERGALRPGRHDLRLRRQALERHARPRRQHGALRPHRRRLRRRPLRRRGGAPEAPVRRRQLLRQRQAHRRRRRAAALRRLPRIGHERQGGLDVEPDPLGQPAHDQGDVRAADGLSLPVHGQRRGTIAPCSASEP